MAFFVNCCNVYGTWSEQKLFQVDETGLETGVVERND